MTTTYKTTGRLTNPVTDFDAARRYLDFLASEEARAILRKAGYGTPP